jgi:hypothetical protein
MKKPTQSKWTVDQSLKLVLHSRASCHQKNYLARHFEKDLNDSFDIE